MDCPGNASGNAPLFYGNKVTAERLLELPLAYEGWEEKDREGLPRDVLVNRPSILQAGRLFALGAVT